MSPGGLDTRRASREFLTSLRVARKGRRSGGAQARRFLKDVQQRLRAVDPVPSCVVNLSENPQAFESLHAPLRRVNPVLHLTASTRGTSVSTS